MATEGTPSVDKLNIYLRIRPVTASVKRNLVCITVNDPHSVTVSPPQSSVYKKRSKSEIYEGFSEVFPQEASQTQVYQKMLNPLVENFLNGKSGMLAALGPSGSGKTYTIFGCGEDPGMVSLAFQQVFSQQEGEGNLMQSHREFYLSMFEICLVKGKSEKIVDLFGADDAYISHPSHVRKVTISDAEEAQSLIVRGLLRRTTATTNVNSQSSRSQCIINMQLEYKDVENKSNCAILTIVDLAGAEREKKTGNQGIRLNESNFINNTSMVFCLCLRSLLEHQSDRKKCLAKHFQNSLLTRVLRDYMEGKMRMSLLLTVRPGEEDYSDTSFLLKQTTPLSRIKYDVSEKPPKTMPARVQVERTELIESEKRLMGELQRKERLLQITQKFSRALWNTLKDYQLRVQTVEADLCRLKGELKGRGTPDCEESRSADGNEVNLDSFPHLSNEEQSTMGELQRKERLLQITQKFSRALWNVLKDYQLRVQTAEADLCRLKGQLKGRGTPDCEEIRSADGNEVNLDSFPHLSNEEQSTTAEADLCRLKGELKGRGTPDCVESRSADGNEMNSEVYYSCLRLSSEEQSTGATTVKKGAAGSIKLFDLLKDHLVF